MNMEAGPAIQALIDRQDINDCLLRYCRGVDRLDRELMLSAYHPDAIDDHGVVVLGAADFVDWAISYHRGNNKVHHHGITNVSIELAGDTAHAECYYYFFAENAEPPGVFTFGRYVDRLERRNGQWRIARRQCLNESFYQLSPLGMPPEDVKNLQGNGPATRDRDDVSYQRPLEVLRPMTG